MNKRVLFIDRDGTVILEPQDKQIDSLEKLRFYPGVICALGKLAKETDYQLVMVTNQDGLGTKSFPEETFWPAHNKMMEVLAGEGVVFSDVLIDPTLPQDMAETRKPRLGMMGAYLNGDYDLEHSFVIGDRPTDLEFAKNLGAKAIILTDEPMEGAELCTRDWQQIHDFLRFGQRRAVIERKTRETFVRVVLNLDGTGSYHVETGLGFLNHMLEQFARHSGFDLDIRVKGDLNVDEHHTIEDTAIVLGQAIARAVGNKRGIARYGFLLPMDDALAQVAVDLSGRAYLVWKVDFQREFVGDVPTEMFRHFFWSLSTAAGMNIHIKAEGENAHHKIEAVFKGFARALRQAVSKTDNPAIPSTKGTI